MALALAFLVLLYVGIAAGIYGLYRLVPSWWPYWIVLVVALGTALAGHYRSVETLLLGAVRAEIEASRGGEPEQLMSALQKLTDAGSAIPAEDLRDFAAVEALCIVASSGRRFELFMDHPPLEKRLAHLAEIGRELGRAHVSGV